VFREPPWYAVGDGIHGGSRFGAGFLFGLAQKLAVKDEVIEHIFLSNWISQLGVKPMEIVDVPLDFYRRHPCPPPFAVVLRGQRGPYPLPRPCGPVAAPDDLAYVGGASAPPAGVQRWTPTGRAEAQPGSAGGGNRRRSLVHCW